MAEHCPPPATQPRSGERLVLNVTSDPANLAPVRRACEEFCRVHGLDEVSAGEVGLCVNEVMANVTRHAYRGATDRPVALTAETAADNAVKITIRDWGSGVDPLALPAKTYDPAEPGGLGLICVRRLLDEVCCEPQREGMLLTMVKRGAVSRAHGPESQRGAQR